MSEESNRSPVGSMFDLRGASAVVIAGESSSAIHVAVALILSGAQVTLWQPVGGQQAGGPDIVAEVSTRLSQRGLSRDRYSLQVFSVDPADDDSVSAGFEETCLHASIPGILVNTVAQISYEAELFEIDMKKFAASMEMSVLGGMLVPTRGFASKWMQERMPGSVVTVLPSGRTRSGRGDHASQAARAAVETLTRSTASELAEHDILVNAVVGDEAPPDGENNVAAFGHIAPAVLYLCSAGAQSGVSGSILEV